MTKLMKRLILLGVAMIAVLVGLKFFSTKQLKATLNTPIILNSRVDVLTTPSKCNYAML